MGIKGLMDESAGTVTRPGWTGEDRTLPVAAPGANVGGLHAVSRSRLPTFGFIFWGGRFTADTSGRVFPTLHRVFAQEGQVGCDVIEDTSTGQPSALDYSRFLAHQQIKGFVRVDGLIGFLSAEDWEQRQAKYDYAMRLFDVDVLAEILSRGGVLHPTRIPAIFPGLDVQARATVIHTEDWRRAQAAIRTAGAQISHWRDLFLQAQKLQKEKGLKAGGEPSLIEMAQRLAPERRLAFLVEHGFLPAETASAAGKGEAPPTERVSNAPAAEKAPQADKAPAAEKPAPSAPEVGHHIGFPTTFEGLGPDELVKLYGVLDDLDELPELDALMALSKMDLLAWAAVELKGAPVPKSSKTDVLDAIRKARQTS